MPKDIPPKINKNEKKETREQLIKKLSNSDVAYWENYCGKKLKNPSEKMSKAAEKFYLAQIEIIKKIKEIDNEENTEQEIKPKPEKAIIKEKEIVPEKIITEKPVEETKGEAATKPEKATVIDTSNETISESNESKKTEVEPTEPEIKPEEKTIESTEAETQIKQLEEERAKAVKEVEELENKKARVEGGAATDETNEKGIAVIDKLDEKEGENVNGKWETVSEKFQRLIKEGKKEEAFEFLIEEKTTKREDDIKNGPLSEKIKNGISKGIEKWDKWGQGEDEKNFTTKKGWIGFGKRFTKMAANIALIGAVSSFSVEKLANIGVGSASAVAAGSLGRKLGIGLALGSVMDMTKNASPKVKVALQLIIIAGSAGLAISGGGLIAGAAVAGSSAVGYGLSKLVQGRFSEKRIGDNMKRIKTGTIDETKLESETKRLEDEIERALKQAETTRIYRKLAGGVAKIAGSIATLEASSAVHDHHQNEINTKNEIEARHEADINAQREHEAFLKHEHELKVQHEAEVKHTAEIKAQQEIHNKEIEARHEAELKTQEQNQSEEINKTIASNNPEALHPQNTQTNESGESLTTDNGHPHQNQNLNEGGTNETNTKIETTDINTPEVVKHFEFSNPDHVISINENGSSLNMQFNYDEHGNIIGTEVGGIHNNVTPDSYSNESEIQKLDPGMRVDAHHDIYQMSSKAHFLNSLPHDTEEYKFLHAQVEEMQKNIIKEYGDVLNTEKIDSDNVDLNSTDHQNNIENTDTNHHDLNENTTDPNHPGADHQTEQNNQFEKLENETVSNPQHINSETSTQNQTTTNGTSESFSNQTSNGLNIETINHINSVHGENMAHVFPDTKSLEAWEGIKDSHGDYSAEKLLPRPLEETNETFKPLLSYMQKIHTETGIAPRGQTIFQEAESPAEFIRRGEIRAAELGILDKIKL